MLLLSRTYSYIIWCTVLTELLNNLACQVFFHCILVKTRCYWVYWSWVASMLFRKVVLFKTFFFALLSGSCVGDLWPVVTDSSGCGIMLFCCPDHENEDSDLILWAPHRLSCLFTGLITNSYPELERLVTCHCNTGKSCAFLWNIKAIWMYEVYFNW